MMFKNIIACMALLAILLDARAESADYSSYLSLRTDDLNRGYTSFTRANWGPGNEVVKEGGKYIVPAGMKMYTPQSDGYFLGDTLAIEGTVIGGNDDQKMNHFLNLLFLPGGVYKHNTSNWIQATNLIVKGTAQSPSRIDWFIQPGRRTLYYGRIIGDESAVLEFGRGSVDSVSRADALSSFNYLCMNISGYNGKIVLDTGTYLRLAYAEADCESTGVYHTFPGAVEIKRDAIFDNALLRRATNAIGGITFNPGSELNVLVHGLYSHYTKYAVTENFRASGDFRIGFTYDRDNPVGFSYNPKDDNGHIPLIHLKGKAAQTDADFSSAAITNLVIANRIGNLPSNIHVGLVDNGDDTKTVAVKWNSVVRMVENNSSNGSSSPMAFHDPFCWSTGVIPEEDFSGEALVTDKKAFCIKSNSNISRKNMILTFDSGSALYNHGWSLEMKELHFVGGSSIFTYAGASNPIFYGKIVIWPNEKPVAFYGWANRCYKIRSEISGNGVVSVKNYNPTSAAMELFGTNLNYAGSFVVDSHADAWKPEDGVDNCVTLYVNDGRNLGGAFSGDDGWKALAVKGHSNVEVRDDVVLDEPSRGIYIENAARFKVPEGKTMTVKQNITFAGELEKLGAGRLTLGGRALFVDGNPESEPLCATNRLVVSEGVLRVVSTNALDGVEATFASGASLELDVSAENSGMLEYGIVNTKWERPFGASGNIGVSFVCDSSIEGEKISIAVCTVKNEAAASLPFAIKRLRNGYYVKTSLRDNGDGTSTLLSTHQRLGSRIVIR